MTKSIDFYFDFISPYSFLAHKRIGKLKRTENIKFPKQLYYALLKAPVKGTKLFKYTPEQVSINVLKHKHWGPWDLKPPR